MTTSGEAWSHSRLHYFIVVTAETAMRLLFSLPRYRFCNRIKAWFLRLMGSKIGKRVVFYPRVWIFPGKYLEIGDDVDMAYEVLITTSGGVKIGHRTLIGYRTQIFSGNHVIPRGRGQIFTSGHEYKPVVIGDDVWIAANCIILPGISIGEGAVIGAGSVVTKSVDPFTIAAGNPARIIKKRCSD